MSAESRIRELVLTNLVGRQVDIVTFVDELLEVAKKIGKIRCRLESDHSLRFELGEHSFATDVDAARGKLRMLCARLNALCEDGDGDGVSPYGGQGTIEGAPTYMAPEQAEGKPEKIGPSAGIAVRFKNCPDEHEFTILPVELRLPISKERDGASK